MNCYFCQTPVIDPEGNGILQCPTCPDARYVCAGSLKNPEVWYVHHRADPFLIEWDIEDKETRIYIGEKWAESEHIYTYKEILPINKETVDSLGQKYSNLKVFL